MAENSWHVLIAEDNAALAGVLEFNLIRAGFRVTHALTGTRAIELLQSQQFDLILTDFQMPGASGEDVCHAARSTGLHLETPIILCTAKRFEIDLQRLQDSYNLAYVASKPFSPRDIAQTVRTLLEASVTCS